jgi:hypothetical protein
MLLFFLIFKLFFVEFWNVFIYNIFLLFQFYFYILTVSIALLCAYILCNFYNLIWIVCPQMGKMYRIICKYQGNLLKGIDKKTGRSEGIEPIKRVFTYVLFSVTHFLCRNKMVGNCNLFYI